MENQNPLIGKTITKVEMLQDKTALRFTCADGTVEYASCYGDCCSSTWIEHIEDPENLLGTVISVEELVLGDGSWEEQDREYVQFYGCKIYTQRGYCLIDYRNESNGYYGGELYWGSGAEPAETDWEVVIEERGA